MEIAPEVEIAPVDPFKVIKLPAVMFPLVVEIAPVDPFKAIVLIPEALVTSMIPAVPVVPTTRVAVLPINEILLGTGEPVPVA